MIDPRFFISSTVPSRHGSLVVSDVNVHGMEPELKAYLDEQFARVNAQFAQVNAQFGQVNAQFEQVNAQFAAVHGRLDTHDRKFEEHDRRFDLLAEALVRIEHRLERARIA